MIEKDCDNEKELLLWKRIVLIEKDCADEKAQKRT